MIRRLVALAFHYAVVRDADRLTLSYGVDALFMARHAVKAAGETDKRDHWSRVLNEVEHRSGYRPG